jgi:hypothetical protein
MLDFLVGDFYLVTSLRMVWSGYFICNKVLEKQGFEELVAEVLTSITDDGLGSTESAKDVGLNEFYHNLVIIGLDGHGFYPFGDIIHSYQDILIPKRQWEGSHEIDTPASKISTMRMGFNGIISL